MRVFLIAILLTLSAFPYLQAQTPAAEPAQAPAPAPSQGAEPPLSPEVQAAEDLLAKSDWAGASAKLQPWIAQHPADAHALFDTGYAADAQDKTAEAEGLYRRAIEADGKSFEAHISLGFLLARTHRAADAREELAIATTLEPASGGPNLRARAWRALAQIDRADNPTEASNDLIEALKISPETPADTLLAADLAEASGQYDSAEAAYRKVLAKDPGSAQANAGMAHLLIEQKKYPEAETMLRAALTQSPEDAALNAQLAAVLAAEDKAEALPLLQKLHGGHPGDEAITRMLAEVLAQAGDYPGSDRLYLTLLPAHPKDAGLYIAHGQNLVRQQKNAEAFAAFNTATELDPADADGWSGLAFAASTTAHPDIVIHALTMRSKYLPEIPSTYFLWATSYDTLHDKPAAVAYYHHFLEAAAGKYPNQEWQARQRLLVLEKKQ